MKSVFTAFADRAGHCAGICLRAFFLGCFALTFASCGDSTDEGDGSQDDPNATVKFMTEAKYTFDGEGEVWRLRFTASGNWRVSIPEADAGWVSVSPAEGTASTSRQVLTITATANDGKARSSKLMMLCGTKKEPITISQDEKVVTIDPSTIPNLNKIYIPQEFSSMDMYKSSATWYFGRSKQSEHFIVFWGKGYGADGSKTPSDLSPSNAYYVDIDDLLAKAEQYYKTNIETLKFADTSKGTSCLNKYKMMIFVLYQTEWLATGSGYDNKIGALWVNPSTCKPVGSTIAHEIGHSFQYMVYCDYLLAGGADDGHSGWRYGYGEDGAGGNGFWEQTAQWQSFQDYKVEAFNNYYFQGYLDCAHLHILHEDPRYSNYFIHWWWVEKHGIEYIGELWRAALYPEDPMQTYMRMNNLTVSAFNDDIWQYAAHMVTWDTDEIRTTGKSRIGAHKWSYVKANNGAYRVSVDKCPETTGYNVIRLTVPTGGGSVTTSFEGLTSAAGYNCGPAAKAGWRYGYVAYMKDGSTRYSDVSSASTGEATWNVPADCDRLWLVVTGAPVEYEQHVWDDNQTNDAKWPYQVSFTGTNVFGAQ